MANPGGIIPPIDGVSVSYQLIDYYTLQPISHSGNYAQVNNGQFIFLSVIPNLTSFDKRVNKIYLTFRQYTSLNYQVYLSQSNAGHFISATRIPLRKYTLNNIICYEADITEIVAASPATNHYFAITASSGMSFYVNGGNAPDGLILTYSAQTGNYSSYIANRLKSFSLRNYSLNVDLFSLLPTHVFGLFNYADELVDFPLYLVNDFAHKDTSSVTSTINTGLPKGFKLNIQQYLYASGTNSYTYVDENYLSHVFVSCTNDSGTFTHYIDNNGGYLILEIINNGYKIYSLNGNIKTFSSSGYLINESIKNGSNVTTIAYSYTNNLLTSVSINNQAIISIAYNTSTVVVSLPDYSSIILSFNSNNFLTAIIDQENVAYQVAYHSSITGLISSVTIPNSRMLTLSFNSNLMVTTVALYSYNSSLSDFYWDVNYAFEGHSYATSFYDDDDLIYLYRFDTSGRLFQSETYRNNYQTLIGFSALKEANGRRFLLSSDSPNFVKEITYDLTTYSHFENSVTMTSSTHLLSFKIKPKEKGQYFLYFEYLRDSINNYQTLNSFSVNISVGDAFNPYSIMPTTEIIVDGFDKINAFIKEIVIPEEYYEKKLNLTLYLSSTGSNASVTIRNVRLYRLEDKNNEYYGLNSYTGGSSLDLTNEDNITFYELSSSLTMDVDNQSYSFSAYYEDLKATFMANFFLNKTILFYNKGKNAYYGAITKLEYSLDELRLVKAHYQNKRLSTDTHPYDGYQAVISYFDNTHFYEKEINYNYSLQATSLKEHVFIDNYLLINQIEEQPYGLTSGTDLNAGIFCYDTFIQDAAYNYNSYGELTQSSTTGKINTTPCFTKNSEHYVYSSNYKFLTSYYQKLYANNTEINHITKSFTYNSLGDVSLVSDAYNHDAAYTYNKFHALTSLLSYDSSYSHNNNVSYDANLNASTISNFNNQNSVSYTYDFKNRVKNISYDSINAGFSYYYDEESVTFTDGNSSYNINVYYSDYHLPIELETNGDTILIYQYTNKNSHLPGVGNPDTDILSSIVDYKDSNNVRQREYTYNYYGGVASIVENGITIEFDTEVEFFNYAYYGRTANSPIIVNNVTYIASNSTFKEEKIYSYVGDPFFKYKEVTSPNFTYLISIKQGVDLSNNASPYYKASIWTTSNVEAVSVTSMFSYYNDENGNQTPYIASQAASYQHGNTVNNYSFDYSYNNNGNLSAISSSSHFALNESYSYDSFNQLASENNATFGHIDYVYDSFGNIKTITKIQAGVVYSFYYDNFNHLTYFTKADGVNPSQTFSCGNYSFGRPSLYKNKVLTWDKNELTQYDNVSFTYDGFGRRITKTSSAREVTYKYVDNLLVEEVVNVKQGDIIVSTDILKYLYDVNNNVIGFTLNTDSTYLYLKDALNNVIAMYDQAGVEVCQYHYDAYGNCIVTPYNQLYAGLANLNPFRYRSYYYDIEIELYYLKSRYYDPETCRFVSVDELSYLNPESLNGLNLYAYCSNNPIMYRDENGNISVLAGIAIGIGVLALTGAGLTIGGRLSSKGIITNIGDSLISAAEIIAGLTLIVTGVAVPIGMTALGTGIGSVANGLLNASHGGTFHAGWVGGELSGILSHIPYFGSAIGTLFGSALTDLIDSDYDISQVNWEKAICCAAVSFGLSWLNGIVEYGTKIGFDNFGVAGNIVLSYNYALLSISNSIVNVWWRKKEKPE